MVLRNISSCEHDARLVRSFQEVLMLEEKPKIIAIDIPIGLLAEAKEGGRDCDKEARRLLGSRRCCVFSPPVRDILKYCDDYRKALEVNRSSSTAKIGISLAAHGLCPKIREVDELMNPRLQEQVREVHPELCFSRLNDGPISEKKKSFEGKVRRKGLLEDLDFGPFISRYENEWKRKDVAIDDILDACVCAWTAERIYKKQAQCIPATPPRDSRDLRMEIWY